MRNFLYLLLCILALSSCVDKVICPAFQSTYILDDSVRAIYYSYLWELSEEERQSYLASKAQAASPALVDSLTTDSLSTPMVASAEGADYWAYTADYKAGPYDIRKNKFGIVSYEPYWLQRHKMRTAPMENVLTPEAPQQESEPSAAEDMVATNALDSSAMILPDSTAIVSTGLELEEDTSSLLPNIAYFEPPKATSELKYNYGYDPDDEMLNVEQVYYNKHFGKYLTKRVPIGGPTSLTEKKGIFGFFKNFFGRIGNVLKRDKSKREKNFSEDEATEPEATSAVEALPTEPVPDDEKGNAAPLPEEGQ